MRMSKGFVAACMLVFGASLLWTGCSSVAGGDPVEIKPGTVVANSSSSTGDNPGSSADGNSSATGALDGLDSLIDFVEIPASLLTRGVTKYAVGAFEMSSTEVTQDLYKMVMGKLPAMDKIGGDIAVANVSWYDAVLFCNAFSKMVNIDTAYVYDGVGEFNILENLTIDYSVESVRLPTDTEWEIAIRGGTSSRFYWGDAVASKYAYYAQTNGPVKVASYLPNECGLYDMGGNVAEWVNDWYGSTSTKDEENPTGASTGEYKIVRGGGWSDKVSAMESANRDNKKTPATHSQMVGFRIVHSMGF